DLVEGVVELEGIDSGQPDQHAAEYLPRGGLTTHSLDRLAEGAYVVADHPLGREALLRRAPELDRLEAIGLLQGGGNDAVVVDDDPAAAVLDHLGHRPPACGDHRR